MRLTTNYNQFTVAMGEITSFSENDDKKLVVRLQSGDEDAFDLLYRKYHVAIYRNIFKLLKHDENAQDILQDVFFCLWEKRNTIDAQKPIANWLFVISYNKSITFLKKASNTCLVFEEILLDISEEDVNTQISEDNLTLVEEAIKLLSPQKRKVFELCKIKRKTYEEAAIELGISRYTVKEYLSDAMARIKSHVRFCIDDDKVMLLAILMISFFEKK